VNYTVSANPDLGARSGSVVITQSEDQTRATVVFNQDAAVGDFSLTASPSSQVVLPGGSATSYQVNIPHTGAFTGAVSLSASGQPQGVIVTFSPSVTTGNTSTMTVTAPIGTALGSFALTIRGQNAAVVRTTTATLNVQDFAVSATPSATAQLPAGSASYTITINRGSGFLGIVNLSASGLPAGASATFNPSGTNGTSSTMTLNVNVSGVPGSFPFTVTGSAGGVSRTASPSVTMTGALPPPTFIPFNAAQLVLSSNCTDNAGWNAVQYGSTIMFGDINGDGKADVCGRGGAGIWCGLSTGTGFSDPILVSTDFSDVQGWGVSPYYSSIRMADVNGDGHIDICGRGSAGIWCALGNGNGTFGAIQLLLNSGFTDSAGWNAPQYGSTIMFADINGDGKADVCGRGPAGILCALSTGTGFSSPTLVSSDFSDAEGWNDSQYYVSVRMADVNGDGHVDICGRGGAGILCAFGNGNGTFGTITPVGSDFSDAAGWNQPQFGSTIMFADIDGDGKADVCGRGAAGVFCSLSAGNSFGSSFLASSDFTDVQTWNQSAYYDSLRLTGVVGNGRIDICGRGSAGILCALR
jgi:hypothetical protein